MASKGRDPDSVFARVRAELNGHPVAVFLDYDGTLTPIADRPEGAVLSAGMRATLRRLAARCPVAVVSGRDRRELAALIGIDGIAYAGSHGFDILLPDGTEFRHPQGAPYAEAAAAAAREIEAALRDVDGVIVESKRYATTVHYRLVPPVERRRVEAAVDAARAGHPGLRKTGGKMIFELRPELDWNKGKAVIWMIDALGLGAADVVPLYLGDDETDEEAFAALADGGIAIRVGETGGATRAAMALPDVPAVGAFLSGLAGYLEARTRGAAAADRVDPPGRMS